MMQTVISNIRGMVVEEVKVTENGQQEVVTKPYQPPQGCQPCKDKLKGKQNG